MRQEAALLPGTAVLAALISRRCLCHCVWVPAWDVSLPGMCPCSSFPNTPGKKFKLLATLMVSVVWGGLPRVTSSGGCLKISRGGLKTTRGLRDAFALSCRREG